MFRFSTKARDCASPELAVALREKRALDDEWLDAVRVFTLEVMATSGAVDTRSV